MKRLFLALALPPEDIQKIINFTEVYKKDQHFKNAKWVDDKNFHITVLFLGGVMETELPVIENLLQGISARMRPFELHFEGLEFFPYKTPRMIWARYQKSLAFNELHEECQRYLLPYMEENKEERKEPIPHVTVARLRAPVNPKQFSFQALHLDPLKINAIEVYESELRPEGPVYTLLKTFPFSP